MRNKSTSDFIASSMEAVISSNEHQSLFNKFASKKDSDDAKDKPSKAKICKDCKKDEDSCYCMPADDSEMSSSDNKKMKSTAAFNVAIDSLLTASAALDSVGMGNTSTLSLKLASLVVEAKKKKEKLDKEEKEELLERLQKGKKGKKPASSKSSSSSQLKTTAQTNPRMVGDVVKTYPNSPAVDIIGPGGFIQKVYPGKIDQVDKVETGGTVGPQDDLSGWDNYPFSKIKENYQLVNDFISKSQIDGDKEFINLTKSPNSPQNYIAILNARTAINKYYPSGIDVTVAALVPEIIKFRKRWDPSYISTDEIQLLNEYFRSQGEPLLSSTDMADAKIRNSKVERVIAALNTFIPKSILKEKVNEDNFYDMLRLSKHIWSKNVLTSVIPTIPPDSKK